MKALLKRCTLMIVLAMMGYSTAQATPPTGKQVSGAITLQGGSSSTVKWQAPLTTSYKVHVFVPKNGTSKNALYRIYPNGKQAGSNDCVSTAPIYPCYEVTIDQTLHQKSWVQLTLNNDADTQWQFTKAKGFVAAVASNLWATESLNLSDLLRFENTGLAVGKNYQGGIIFYLDQTGEHGLIAAPTDQSNQVSWQFPETITTATATAIGTGLANTNKIVMMLGTSADAAAVLCYNLVAGGYSDWYLPSKDELALMYQTIGPGAPAPLTNVGNFDNTETYWSSSEYDHTTAWAQYFGGDAMSNNEFKGLEIFSVRAIRSF